MTINLNKNEINNITAKVLAAQTRQIQQFVLFIGHAHSGHSIIGAILDAHPSVAIANEVNIVNLIKNHKLNKVEIESILLHYSFCKKSTKDWHNSEYKHGINNSHQGKTHTPLVIGDKKAGGTARILHKDFWIMHHLQNLYEDQLKVIYIKRNPIDIVAAYSHYMQQAPCQFHVDRYLENLAVVNQSKQLLPPSSFIEIEQSTFINSPHTEIKKLFNFISINPQPNDINSWVAHVKSDIKGKSDTINIPDELKNQLIL